MVILGEKLRDLRKTNNLTQEQLAMRLGLAVSAISSYESCSRRPSYEILIKYARIFHVSTDYILGLSKRDYIDVTGLNDKEKAAVMNVVTVITDLH